MRKLLCLSFSAVLLCCHVLLPVAICSADDIDFNRDVRPILSDKCLVCHGPDKARQEAGLRLDDAGSATSPLASGSTAVVPGNPGDSELLARVSHADVDMRMPPAAFGKSLSTAEIATLRRWIEAGAPYARHWSYQPPVRPAPPAPELALADWPYNAIDQFALRRMIQHRLRPMPEADRYALIRRVTMDLTGLPPSVAEADAFASGTDPEDYARLVDDLLSRPAYGEHWARKWLDLARYADSAGYADDPSRTIWGYRDWVIRAINNNMPFDQFTIEQLAGDLLPEPTDDQLVATAFHRNTLTNNEGGTQDEEFRNVAVVDRVNTTLAVWMGTTMACAQCHDHKYDPISQEEYFRLFAVFNNTQDADRRDESPLIQLFTEDQIQKKSELEQLVLDLKAELETPTPELAASQQRWESRLNARPDWHKLKISQVTRANGDVVAVRDDGAVLVAEPADADTYTIDIPLTAAGPLAGGIAAIRLETLPHESLPAAGSGHGGGNFVISGIKAQLIPQGQTSPVAQFVRITNHGKGQILSLAEVQVFSGGSNVAMKRTATQHSTAFGGPPELAVDGNTDGDYQKNSVTHTETVDEPWWEVDLGAMTPIDRLAVWNRTDNGLQTRLSDYSVQLLDAGREVVWQSRFAEPPNPSTEITPGNVRDLRLASVFADYHQPQFEPDDVLAGKTGTSDGWAVGGSSSSEHQLVLIPARLLTVTEDVTLRILIEQQSPHKKHLLGHFRFSATDSQATVERSRLPQEMVAVLEILPSERTDQQRNDLASWYRNNAAPELQANRKRLAASQKTLNDMKPATSVPILRELTENRRETRLQYRGSYLDTGPVLTEGLPSAFYSPHNDGPVDRLAVARWIVDSENPLTARVVANRMWESLFGRGIVLTSEEFGSQGELPTHPELLDWLACELLESGWDTKALLKTIVLSATYRQSAMVTADAASLDSDNRWLARGPRVRLSAEMVRDQALFAAGLLKQKLFGPPVNPPQPNLGLTAAFGSSTDWKTSDGDDRYRRGLYTTWRRSNPYPSMATFDAPNREVCTIRRNRTNTPLQSLVTLNDPVYVEAAQSLARRATTYSADADQQLTFAFRQCLIRPPSSAELAALAELRRDVTAELLDSPDDAMKLATEPLGPLPERMNPVDAAAMTVVCNVLLNLDEMFLKR